MVLVHGAGVSSRYWRPGMAALRGLGRYRVSALDLPGFGRSARTPLPVDLRFLARHLLEWKKEIHGRPCHVVGQSLGCEIAVLAAAAGPMQVRSLALVGPAGLPRLESLPLQMLQAGLDAPLEPPALYRVILPDYVRAGPLRFFDALAAQLRSDAESALAELDLPVMVLRGRRDPIANAQRAWAILKLLKHGQAVAMTGAHASHFSHPRELARCLDGFWREVDAHEFTPSQATARTG